MRLYSMTATFGKLEHATLTFTSGLNILEAPNEWGKSTWCAFLAAMLYGIDSRVHSATKQGLADKARYDPWSGQPMSGRIELNWNGRDITIERNSTKRAAFREFRAYETRSGLPVKELTGENCGQMLLGVEKDVFLRAGFIRLSDMPVTPNEALRRRLNALVTTGDESGAADRLALQLNKLKNECRANRSKGLLPQAEAHRDVLQGKLERLAALKEEADELAHKQVQLEKAHGALLTQQDALTQAAAHARQEALSQLRQLRQSRADKEAQRLALQPPSIPEAFQGLSARDAGRQARTDSQVFAQACRERRSPARLVLAALPAIVSLLCLLIPHWIGWCVCLLGMLSSMMLLSCERSRQKRAAATARALEEKYGAVPPEEWENTVLALLTEKNGYDSSLLTCERELADLDNAISQVMQTLGETPLASASEDVARRIGECEQSLRQIHMHRGRCQGQIEALGDETQLRSQLDRLDERISKLNQTHAALELAQKTLSQATFHLQSRFAPRITKRASQLFSRLTDGRYQRLSLTQELSVHTCAESEDTLRSILWRSDGTTDQLYLALRLAVAAELTPHAPLVLDDALVRFDDTRLRAAIAVLQEEAKDRQVILFTCQSREKNMI